MHSASSLMKSTFDTYSSTEILLTLESMPTKEMCMVIQDESVVAGKRRDGQVIGTGNEIMLKS